jgi:D-alanyl-lipoteichoic acid acyltransferase DltB (MBOAT superfamily)
MLFNSAQFALFFPVVTLLYFLVPHRLRWLLLLGASCGFYMAFIPAYIVILFATIVIDYYAALLIDNSSAPSRRKHILLTSIVSTCLVLFAFKYFNFFNTNLSRLAAVVGWNYPVPALNIILPIGLSFHTFQSLSYVIEVYRRSQKPERHFGIYALYVMFYPQLVAGPIERPQNLLHQFHEEKRFDFDDLCMGLKLMAWGLFKKVVIADRLAIYVNNVYGSPASYSGMTLTLATVGFAFQIYCDFSGYSDIAIGAARVMGFKLMTNFDRPYSAQEIGEFWKRWHISLSTWFRDYVYIPLGGNRVSSLKLYRNLFITFLISGLWHGANWTFIIWGGLHGAYMVVGRLTRKWRRRVLGWCGFSGEEKPLGFGRMLGTFALVCVAWVFFRANSLSDVSLIVRRLGSGWDSLPTLVPGFSGLDAIVVIVALIVLHAEEKYRFLARKATDTAASSILTRWPVYYALAGSILVFGVFQGTKFVYFQF